MQRGIPDKASQNIQGITNAYMYNTSIQTFKTASQHTYNNNLDSKNNTHLNINYKI